MHFDVTMLLDTFYDRQNTRTILIPGKKTLQRTEEKNNFSV